MGAGLPRDEAFDCPAFFEHIHLAMVALIHLSALTAAYFGKRPKVSKGLAPPGALRCAPGPFAPVPLRGIASYELQATLRFATSANAEGATR